MTDELRSLFDRWERVWHEGQYDLIPTCVGASDIRHDEAGDRTVPRGTYTMRPLFSASASAETRLYRADTQFLQTDPSRMIAALESKSLATTGALKCRTLW